MAVDLAVDLAVGIAGCVGSSGVKPSVVAMFARTFVVFVVVGAIVIVIAVVSVGVAVVDVAVGISVWFMMLTVVASLFVLVAFFVFSW